MLRPIVSQIAAHVTQIAAQPAEFGAYRRGVALVLTGSLCSSWIGLGVRMVETATPWQLLIYRSIGAIAVLLVVIAVRNRGTVKTVFRSAGLVSLVGGLGLAAAFTGGIVAMHQASVANAMFLLAGAPFLAAILGRLVLKERVRPATWVAIAVAMTGVVMMVGEGISFGFLWGNVAGLCAALGLAVFVIALRWGHLTDMLPLNVFGGLLGLILATAVCLATGDGVAVSTHDLIVALAMGVFQLGLSLVLITLGSRSVPAAELSLLTMAEVVLAPLWVYLVLGETAGTLTLAGGALLLAAIAGDALTGLRDQRRRSAIAALSAGKPDAPARLDALQQDS
jgi:DME family drug/metabolite transporter